jgi:hypothetical protein
VACNYGSKVLLNLLSYRRRLSNQSVVRLAPLITGWPVDNEHWRISCYCWAMYLRLLRRYLEHGEIVPYERRLEV